MASALSVAIGALLSACERRYPEPSYGEGRASAPAGTAPAVGVSPAGSQPPGGGVADTPGGTASR